MAPAAAIDPDAVRRVPNSGWDERVTAYRCGGTVDSFAVRTERYLAIVDTLVSQASMRAVMDDLASSIPPRRLLVLNTHGDWDHVWGNGLFSGPTARYPAPIVGSSHALARMRSAEAGALLSRSQEQHPGRYSSASWEPPTVSFSGDGQIDGGDLRLELLATPGHTPDHLSVWIPELRLLLAGDASEAPLPWVSTAEALPALRASLHRLAALNARTVLYCHAPGMVSSRIIERNIAYFDELEARCRAAVAMDEDPVSTGSWSLEKAVPDLMPDTAQVAFYREAHAAAIRVMAEWVELSTPG